MTINQLCDICEKISFGNGFDDDWTLKVEQEYNAFWIQWKFYAPDSSEPGADCTIQKGRKWRISFHATEDEVVKTAFAAALMALEHEARERFEYCGQPIFHPHMDVNALVGLAVTRPWVKRKEVDHG